MQAPEKECFDKGHVPRYNFKLVKSLAYFCNIFLGIIQALEEAAVDPKTKMVVVTGQGILNQIKLHYLSHFSKICQLRLGDYYSSGNDLSNFMLIEEGKTIYLYSVSLRLQVLIF